MEKGLMQKAHAMYEQFVKLMNPKLKLLHIELTRKRNADCYVFLGDKPVAYLELEWAARWKQQDFPYETVHFPSTKAKYAEKDLPVFMITFNSDVTNGLIIDAKTMVKSQEVEVGRTVSPTGTMATFGERFIDVDSAKVVFGFENFEDYMLDKLGIRH